MLEYVIVSIFIALRSQISFRVKRPSSTSTQSVLWLARQNYLSKVYEMFISLKSGGGLNYTPDGISVYNIRTKMPHTTRMVGLTQSTVILYYGP